MLQSKSDSSRKRILDAATQIALERGPKQLTLDNVAKQCGMSKGGLMHHFKNKDALLAGMVEAMISLLMTDTEETQQQHDDGLAITTLLRSRQRHHEKIAMYQAKILLVAAVENPELLKPMQELMKCKKQEIESQDAIDESTLLWLAADGLSFQELMEISPFDETERNAIRQKLIAKAVALEEAKQ